MTCLKCKTKKKCTCTTLENNAQFNNYARLIILKSTFGRLDINNLSDAPECVVDCVNKVVDNLIFYFKTFNDKDISSEKIGDSYSVSFFEKKLKLNEVELILTELDYCNGQYTGLRSQIAYNPCYKFKCFCSGCECV